MFDIGFSELFVVAVVALIVLGPERLPKAARFAGLWVRRARAQWHSVKSEWESELADDELKRSLRETREQLERAQDRLRDTGRGLQRDLDAMRRGVERDHDRPRREPGPGAPPEHDPDPGEPARRDPGGEPPERRDPGDAPPHRDPDPDPDTGVPVPGDPRTDVPVEEPGRQPGQGSDAEADWRERQRREYELIEREVAGFDPDTDDDEALQVGPRTRAPRPADAPSPATGPAGHPDSGSGEPRPDTPPSSRDHDQR